MGTFRHQLRPVPLTGSRATPTYPRRVVCVDTESRVLRAVPSSGAACHQFRLGCASCTWFRSGRPSSRDEVNFSTRDRFWDWLQAIVGGRGATWVFAHNLGYDFTQLGGWRLLDRGGMSLVSAVLEDPPTHLITLYNGRVIHWVDTLNYWRCSLSELGNSVGFPKGIMPGQSDSEDAWREYCRRDCEIVERAVCSLVRTVATSQMCSWQPTAPALAWRTFLTNFYHGGIFIHDDQDATRAERESYYGGRVECHRLGVVSEPIDVVDVNSLYPSVMAGRQYPVSLRQRVSPVSPRQALRDLASRCGVGSVKVRSATRDYPLRSGGRTVYARGGFDTFLSGPELVDALTRYDVEHVYDLWLYDQSDIFTGYVKHFWDARVSARARGDVAGELLTKLMLNSLHGKFGQRGRRWTKSDSLLLPSRWGCWTEYRPATGEQVRCRAIAGLGQVLSDDGESPHSFPLISSYVTGYSRLRMSQLKDIAGRGNVVYEDTDCLHLLDPGCYNLEHGRLIDPGAIGALKLVGEYPSAEYWGPKDYRVGDQVVTSSVKSSAIELSPGTYRQDRWPGIAQTIQAGPTDRYWTEEVTLRLSRSNYRNRVAPDGSVMPLFIDEARHG